MDFSPRGWGDRAYPLPQIQDFRHGAQSGNSNDRAGRLVRDWPASEGRSPEGQRRWNFIPSRRRSHQKPPVSLTSVSPHSPSGVSPGGTGWTSRLPIRDGTLFPADCAKVRWARSWRIPFDTADGNGVAHGVSEGRAVDDGAHSPTFSAFSASTVESGGAAPIARPLTGQKTADHRCKIMASAARWRWPWVRPASTS
jgi:hypothetical protein